jgi:hypothetical protein
MNSPHDLIRYDLQLIASWIEPGSRVLDLGCGEGDLLQHLPCAAYEHPLRRVEPQFPDPAFSLAVGILQQRGFKNVASLAGGSAAWIDAGYPVFGNEPKAAAAPQRQVQSGSVSPAAGGRDSQRGRSRF